VILGWTNPNLADRARGFRSSGSRSRKRSGLRPCWAWPRSLGQRTLFASGIYVDGMAGLPNRFARPSAIRWRPRDSLKACPDQPAHSSASRFLRYCDIRHSTAAPAASSDQPGAAKPQTWGSLAPAGRCPEAGECITVLDLPLPSRPRRSRDTARKHRQPVGIAPPVPLEQLVHPERSLKLNTDLRWPPGPYPPWQDPVGRSR